MFFAIDFSPWVNFIAQCSSARSNAEENNVTVALRCRALNHSYFGGLKKRFVKKTTRAFKAFPVFSPEKGNKIDHLQIYM